MKSSELNQFIMHYLTEDKTHRAIMLTAPWGAGKSYYIQNELKPFLEKEENGKRKCIIVSLYGLKTLSDISKELYLESRTPTAFKRKNIKKISAFSKSIVSGIVGVGKTILKTLTQIDLNFSVDNPNWQKLYSAVDFSGKLIVLEDLERSGINVLEVMGYVNSLVEQDGIKVLLVANETEFLKFVNSEPNKDEITEKIPSDNTKLYLRIKEKTIGDTIEFEGDSFSAVKHIISGFNETYFKPFLNDSALKEILSLLQTNGITNLRSFIFACQKTNDIFEYIKPDPSKDFDFMNTIFCSIILLSQKIKTGTKLMWKGSKNFSIELSSEKYPLFHFCYDYVMRQKLENSKIEDAKKALAKMRLYDKKKSNGDKDLETLYNWWLCSEKDVKEAVESITERLNNEADISFFEYGRIAVFLIGAKSVIDCDINKAKELLIKNLYNKGSEIDPDYLFTSYLGDDVKSEVKNEFEQLKADMIASIIAKDSTLFDFDYQPSNISTFKNDVHDNLGRIRMDGSFMSRLDPEKIAEMLKHCSAENIQDFRSVFLLVYELRSIGDYLEGDKKTLEQLLTLIKDLSTYDGFDRIQKHQLSFFKESINKIIAKL